MRFPIQDSGGFIAVVITPAVRRSRQPETGLASKPRIYQQAHKSRLLTQIWQLAGLWDAGHVNSDSPTPWGETITCAKRPSRGLCCRRNWDEVVSF